MIITTFVVKIIYFLNWMNRRLSLHVLFNELIKSVVLSVTIERCKEKLQNPGSNNYFLEKLF